MDDCADWSARADSAWSSSGGPPVVDAAVAAMAEAHALQLTLLGLQRQIVRASGAATAAGGAWEADKEEQDEQDEAVEAARQEPFDGQLPPPPSGQLPPGGFRALRLDFATPTECAQLRAAAVLGLAQCFRRGGQTTLSITPALRDRLEGCGAAAAVPRLEDVLRRMSAAAQHEAGGNELSFCGGLLVRLAPPRDAAAAPASWPLPPRQPYWSAHVDQHNVAWYDVSTLLYLSEASVDFEGGAFAFHDDDADRTVAPRRGALLVFSSGAENPHSVARVTRGVRFALAAWFTRDARHRVALPLASVAPAAGAAWALGGVEAALLSAATNSLASNDPLRTRLLAAHARGASLFSEMRAAHREGGRGVDAVADPSAVLAWAETLAPPRAGAQVAAFPAQPVAAGAGSSEFLEALRSAVQCRAAVCQQLARRASCGAGATGAPATAPIAAPRGNAKAASAFDVFDF